MEKEWMHEWMTSIMNRKGMHEWMDEEDNEWMNGSGGCRNEGMKKEDQCIDYERGWWMDGWKRMNGWMNEGKRVNGWMEEDDKRMDGRAWMNRWMEEDEGMNGR